MPQCPRCRYRFRVMEDEDDGQHGCPSCSYTGHEDEEEDDPLCCDYCGEAVDPDGDLPHAPYCSVECGINAELESYEHV